MMPSVAEERRAPRIVGVEFPFGHAFGMPHDRVMQRQVLELALRVLAGPATFGTRIDLDVEWPVPLREAYRAWQPNQPSPIAKKLLEPGSRQRTLHHRGSSTPPSGGPAESKP